MRTAGSRALPAPPARTVAPRVVDDADVDVAPRQREAAVGVDRPQRHAAIALHAVADVLKDVVGDDEVARVVRLAPGRERKRERLLAAAAAALSGPPAARTSTAPA